MEEMTDGKTDCAGIIMAMGFGVHVIEVFDIC
jgi:hypothetical protein